METGFKIRIKWGVSSVVWICKTFFFVHFSVPMVRCHCWFYRQYGDTLAALYRYSHVKDLDKLHPLVRPNKKITATTPP